MIIETTRLKIVPLTMAQFCLLLSGIDKMEQDLKLTPSGEVFDEDTQQAMSGLYQEAIKHNEKYIWYTNWQIILKSENTAIGSACFTKEPDETGAVEIGYGTYLKYRNKGYMTEAVRAMCKWALDQPEVESVIAETEKENYASHNVLKNSGLEKNKETESSFFWTTK